MTESPVASSAERVHSALDQLGSQGRARVLAVTARYSYEPSPVVRLGRAVALGRAQCPRVGLEHVQRLGEQEAAAYRRALQLPGNAAEDAYLAELLTGLDGAQVSE